MSDERHLENERHYNAARAQLLAEWLPRRGVGAELGVFQGRFSRTLLDVSEASRLHLVDPWYFATAYWHWGVGNRSTVDALVNILVDFKQEIDASRVLVHVADDLAVLRELPDDYFDWVYLDSTHQYRHTVEELTLLARKVRVDGIVAGDDWRPDPTHRHHGVYRAVREFVSADTYAMVGVDEPTTQWAIRRMP